MNQQRSPGVPYNRALLALFTFCGFAFLYLAGRLFGNDGIEYLFADVDREALHTAGHIFVYGTLAVMLAKTFADRYLLAWLAANLLAAGEEWHQLVVPGRVASLQDALLNFVSITVFLALACHLEPAVRRALARVGPQTNRTQPSVSGVASQPVTVLDAPFRADPVIMGPIRSRGTE